MKDIAEVILGIFMGIGLMIMLDPYLTKAMNKKPAPKKNGKKKLAYLQQRYREKMKK